MTAWGNCVKCGTDLNDRTSQSNGCWILCWCCRERLEEEVELAQSLLDRDTVSGVSARLGQPTGWMAGVGLPTR